MDERSRRLPSGQQTIISNRVGWAKTYLKNAGLLQQPRRAVVVITPAGQAALTERPARIDADWLRRYPSFHEFLGRQRPREDEVTTPLPRELDLAAETPEETIEQSYSAMREALAGELLDAMKNCTPVFFERLVVELLVAMGYGGSIAEAGQAVGRSGDGGIDGIIKEDKLGLDIVCVQAKRWNSNSVGRPDVQSFAGSMEPHRAKKGVFITTSQFSRDAIDYVKQTERKIVLIDGPGLAALMIEHNVGVSAYKTFTLKKVDADYFDE